MGLNMKAALLTRNESSDHGTMGALVIQDRGREGRLPLHVMEPPWRDNRRNRSCIPAGAYPVIPHVSPRFGRCLLVTEVPDRSHILIHAGNVGGDVEIGYHTHTHGCLLPGIRRGRIEVRGRTQRAVLSSRAALRALMAWADNEPFILEIRNA